MPGEGLRIESLLLSIGKRLVSDFMLREVGGGYILNPSIIDGALYWDGIADRNTPKMLKQLGAETHVI
jgi:hypothetical protein